MGRDVAATAAFTKYAQFFLVLLFPFSETRLLFGLFLLPLLGSNTDSCSGLLDATDKI